MNEHKPKIKFSVSQTDSMRIDSFLAKIFNDTSRGNITQWIANGKVTIGSQTVTKNNAKINFKDIITVSIPEPSIKTNWQEENIKLDIVFEDEDILVINKPSGLTMHPGAGQSSGTLANALAYYDKNLTTIARMGIVHRLDKNTSGVLVVAKTTAAHHNLVMQLQNRSMTKIYHTLVNGLVIAGGSISEPIGRHPKHRTIMAVNHKGKEAISHFLVMKKYHTHTLLEVKIETGRTHQIRVHMQHIRHTIVGDRTYGRGILPKGCSAELSAALHNFNRQALHAHTLEFRHPVSNQELSFTAPYPKDFAELLKILDSQ